MFTDQVKSQMPFGKKTMRNLANMQVEAMKYSVVRVDQGSFSGSVQWDLFHPNRLFFERLFLFSHLSFY